MTEEILYNGKTFPEYIFSVKVDRYLFFEFNFAFEGEFWTIFKRFFEKNRVKSIIVENLRPNYFFKEKVSVAQLPDSFAAAARTMQLAGYLSSPASLYMITEEAIVYDPEQKDLFCLVLTRDFDLAILGFSNAQDAEFLSEIALKDVSDYLRMIFKGEDLPGSFRDTLNRNWKVSTIG